MKKIKFLLLCIVLIGTSCSKDEGGTPSGSSSSTNTSSSFYFRGEINGIGTNFSSTDPIFLQDYFGYTNSMIWDVTTGLYDFRLGVSIAAANAEYDPNLDDIVLKKYLTIAYYKELTYLDCSSEEDNFFSKINTNFSYGRGRGGNDEPSIIEGVVISYYDADGKYWSSDIGSALQNNSTFHIKSHDIKSSENINSNGVQNALLMNSVFEFDCILYDNLGNSMNISNGVVRASTIRFDQGCYDAGYFNWL